MAYLDVKYKVRSCTTFVSLCISNQIIVKCGNIFFTRIRKMRAKYKMFFYLKVSMRAYRRKIARCGSTIFLRNQKLIRNTMTLVCQLQSQVKLKFAAYRVLKPYFARMLETSKLYNIFARCLFLILKIQYQFKSQLDLRNSRIQALKQMWQNELKELLMTDTTNPEVISMKK